MNRPANGIARLAEGLARASSLVNSLQGDFPGFLQDYTSAAKLSKCVVRDWVKYGDVAYFTELLGLLSPPEKAVFYLTHKLPISNTSKEVFKSYTRAKGWMRLIKEVRSYQNASHKKEALNGSTIAELDAHLDALITPVL